MPNILIRDLDTETVNRLKARAGEHGRSLQSELKTLLERAVGCGTEGVSHVLASWEQRFGDRKFSSSADLIREDRRR